MGLCAAKGATLTKEERAKQKQIEMLLRRDKKKYEEEQKLLLLGTGESGKSTIAKQLKMIYQNGFNEDERRSYKDVIHSNAIIGMRSLVLAADRLGLEYASPEAKERASFFTSTNMLAGQELTPKVAEDIKFLWNEPAIKAAFARSNEFQLSDSCQYYFENIDRITGDFEPNEQDILRARMRTTGISETVFQMDGKPCRLVDVGGQRSERKKWLHCFQEVTAVIFCVAMSEYDLKLMEDENVNRMHESLRLFDDICNSQWFSSTSIILFLNKNDIFKEKIQKVDLKVCFEDYSGGCNYEAASTYIKNKFISLNRDTSKKHIYAHITVATDTDNIRFVFSAIKDIILHEGLGASGF
eukprot:TRINITY_DN2170_c0_g4_i1.p1 TRINITY_DN2170_c0_g4~~TRINITY_DN2170_c0_g4_i1.p1  ORF type:complete len:355 (-),score=87.94 TRINITY_DN2170_c0_g4_i1:236-1300(-)